ncbi:MAG TPA: hypothetical protein PLV81_13295 [Spirochaetota bacterium]|nr:hypothetical protein [Spirochaetota bacterium]
MIRAHLQVDCNDEMQEKVLGVADGTISDEKTIQEVLEHLSMCKECFALYDNYFLLMEHPELDEQIEDDILSLDFNIANNTFVPVTSSTHIIPPLVAVLAQPDVPAVEIEYPFKGSIIKIRIIYGTNHNIDISIYCNNDGIKIYLLNGSRFDIATVSNGMAMFSSVEMGVILLLIDFKKVIRIHINN